MLMFISHTSEACPCFLCLSDKIAIRFYLTENNVRNAHYGRNTFHKIKSVIRPFVFALNI